MDARELKERLCEALVEQSGLERHRAYLGMSGIGRCARELYQRYVDGVADMSERHHFYSWVGYLFEGAVVGLFGEEGIERLGVEVVAEFDPRFRGHVDLQTPGGDLVEIKSVSWHRFHWIRRQGPDAAHKAQVQMYLRHGGWERGFLVYVARDAPWKEWRGLPIWVFEVEPDEVLGERLDGKAMKILAAVDGGEVPGCSCGRCDGRQRG